MEFAAAVAPVWNKSDSHSYRLRENQATASEKPSASGQNNAGYKLRLPNSSLINDFRSCTQQLAR